MRLLLSFRGLSPGTQVFLLILIVMFCGIMSLAVAYLLSMAVWGREVLLPAGSPAAMNLNFMRLTQIVNQLGFFVIPPLLLAWISESSPKKFLGFSKPKAIHLLITVALVAAAGPSIGALIEWNERLVLPGWLSGIEHWMRNAENTAAGLTERLLEIKTTGGLVINIVMIGLLPAIGEELLFRSAFIGIFRKICKGIHLPVILSAVIFSALHLQFFGFFPRLMLGIAFGYLFVWSGSIWVPALAHFINNTTVVVASYLFSRGAISVGAEDLGKTDSTAWIVISALTCILLISLVYRTRREEPSSAVAASISPNKNAVYED